MSVATLCLLTMLLWQTPARADNFGLHHPTGATFQYFYSGLSSAWTGPMDVSIDVNYIPRDVNPQKITTHDGSEISVVDDEYPWNNPGEEECLSASPYNHCAHAHVRFNTTSTS